MRFRIALPGNNRIPAADTDHVPEAAQWVTSLAAPDFQRIASTIYSTLNQYRVILEVSPQFQASPDTLSRIYVNSSAGQQVPLSTLVSSALPNGNSPA